MIWDGVGFCFIFLFVLERKNTMLSKGGSECSWQKGNNIVIKINCIKNVLNKSRVIETNLLMVIILYVYNTIGCI